jgi:hypothetical protein
MKLHNYLTAIGSWLSLLFGIGYLAVFILLRTKADFAVGIAFISLSLAIRAYGKVTK